MVAGAYVRCIQVMSCGLGQEISGEEDSREDAFLVMASCIAFSRCFQTECGVASMYNLGENDNAMLLYVYA